MNDHQEDRLTDAVKSATTPLHLSDEARDRIANELRHARGNTTLRVSSRPQGSQLRWLAVAAAAVVLALVVWPLVGRNTTVSAAQVLGRTQQAMSARSTGIEITTYDLEIGGALAALLPAEQAGRFTVEETIDHDHDGRYRLIKRGADGSTAAGAVDDPLAQIHQRYLRIDGRGHLLRFPAAPSAEIPASAVRTLALRSLIGLMQTAPDATVRDVVAHGMRAYEVVTTGSGLPVPVSLQRAQAVVATGDARLLDFEAAGTLADRPFSVTFTLRENAHLPAGSGDFTLPAAAGDVVTDLAGGTAADFVSLIGRCLIQ